MAVELPLLPWTLTAGADLSAKQFHFVKLSTVANETALVSGAGEPAVGVLQNNPTSGRDATVMTLGVSKVLVGTTVTAGEALSSDAAGKARPATGADSIVAYSLHAATAGEYVSVLIAARGGQGTLAKPSVLSIPVTLAQLANGDVVTNFVPGFAGTILNYSFVVTVPATTAAKAATLNLEIGTTNVTGGALALTSANCTPLGKATAATAITAANAFTDSDTISVEAASVTAFIEGAGVLLITVLS